MQKPSSSVAAMLVCSLTSGAAWLCGTQPMPAIRPAPPPVTAPVAPAAAQPPVLAPLPPTPQPAPPKASSNRQPGDVIDLHPDPPTRMLPAHDGHHLRRV